MSYRLLAPVYDWVALRVSRYRSPALLTAKVLGPGLVHHLVVARTA